MENRKKGYYWVTYYGLRMVAHWGTALDDKLYWWLPGWRESIPESNLENIEETPVTESAPEMKKLLADMYDWLEMYAGTRDMGKHHPVLGLIDRYEKLIKEIES